MITHLIERFRRVTAATAKFIQAKIPGDGVEPSGKLGGDLVARCRFPRLHENVLSNVFGFRFVPHGAPDEIHDGLFVFLDELGECGGIALFDAQHQGGIGIEFGRHHDVRLGEHRPALKVSENLKVVCRACSGHRGRMLKNCLTLCLVALMLVVGISCARKPQGQTEVIAPSVSTNSQTFQVRGVILELSASGKTVRIRHEEIPNYMPAMTMPFDVRETNELTGLAVGDSVTFQMKVTETDGWIEQIKKIAGAVAQTNILPAGATMRIVREVEPLSVGDMLPDYRFTNQLGRAVSLAELRGNAVAITFIFTRCPFPTFCPLMTSNFKSVHELLTNNPAAPTNWHMLEITIDPEFDTPERLKGHAAMLKVDTVRWSFLTGTLMDVTALSEQFGLQFTREPGGGISHNLRTVVIDAAGRVQKIIPENKWTPQELADELVKAAAAK